MTMKNTDISFEEALKDLEKIVEELNNGDMDLEKVYERFKKPLSILNKSGKKIGMHLHDHSGKGYFNYRQLKKYKINKCDSSIRGMGKGFGNLRTEQIIKPKYFNIGTFITAPPMPIGAEINPETRPKIILNCSLNLFLLILLWEDLLLLLSLSCKLLLFVVGVFVIFAYCLLMEQIIICKLMARHHGKR